MCITWSDSSRVHHKCASRGVTLCVHHVDDWLMTSRSAVPVVCMSERRTSVFERAGAAAVTLFPFSLDQDAVSQPCNVKKHRHNDHQCCEHRMAIQVAVPTSSTMQNMFVRHETNVVASVTVLGSRSQQVWALAMQGGGASFASVLGFPTWEGD